jgi:outer membrane protein TolC
MKIKKNNLYNKKLMKIIISLFVISRFTIVYAQPVDISNAQEILLKNNPKLKAIKKQVESLEKKIPQASSLEDPRIKLGLNNIPISNLSFKESDMTSKEIGIIQMIPLFGKLSVREQIAALYYQKAIETYRFYKSLLLHELRTNFYEIGYLKEYSAVLEDIKKYLTLMLEIQKSRSITGIGTLSDVLQVSVELLKIDEELINMRSTIAEKEQMIIYLLGKTNYENVQIDTGTIVSSVSIKNISYDDSLKNIVSENPELKLLSLQILIDEKEINYKQKEYYPDMEVGLSYMQRDNSSQGVKRDDMFSVMVTFNIPAWFINRNIPAVQEMKLKKGESIALFDDKKNEIFFAVNKIAINISKWEQLHKLYSNSIIPQLDTTFNTELTQYKTADTEFMKLIDTIRMRLYYQNGLITIKKEYLIALSFMKFLSGDISIETKGF